MKNKIDLTIVILNYNSQFWLKKTLTSLKQFYLTQTELKVSVVVVDNHSTDKSVAMLKKEFRWTELIEMTENKGFAAGNNVALKQVQSRYVMLLNSDVEFTEHSNLDLLVNYLDEHSEVGVISPRLNLVNGNLDEASHRGEPTLWASFTHFSKLGTVFPKSTLFAQYHQTYKDLATVHEVDACSGAAMIIRVEAMNEVGLLDEQFFMYAEDLDWCKRFREAGYQVVFHPAVKLIHHKYKSGISSYSTQLKRKTKGYFYDTMLQYYDKHYAKLYPNWIRIVVKNVIDIKKKGLE